MIHLKVGTSRVVSTVEFGDFGNPAFLGCLTPSIKDFPADAFLFDPQFAADTMEGISAVLIVF